MLSLDDLLISLVGSDFRYEFIIYIFVCIFTLVVFDIILSFIFGLIMSLFKK